MLGGIELTAKFKCSSSYKEFLCLVLINAVAYLCNCSNVIQIVAKLTLHFVQTLVDFITDL
jgi:hypothetical protein